MRSLLARVLWLLLPVACVEPYYPSGVGAGNQMVVNGYIDGLTSTATVKLTRGVSLSDPSAALRVSKANVTINGSDGSEITLDELSGDSIGFYRKRNINVDEKTTYTLKINTGSGSYTSDEIKMLRSPDIDSISWVPSFTGAENEKGIYLYVNTHDAGNNTRYYRWTFKETWEFNVVEYSEYKKIGQQPIPRKQGEFVYYCWASRPSTSIMVNSTAGLTKDQVSMRQLYFIHRGSRKLSRHYRFAVRQYAMSKQEYEFWDQLEKTSESLGGLFDPLPNQVVGNVHSDNNSSEPVLGYFSGGYASEKVLYIDYQQLPREYGGIERWSFDCPLRLLYLWQLDQVKEDEVFLRTFGTPVAGYILANQMCGDCTKVGGSNVQPADWLIK